VLRLRVAITALHHLSSCIAWGNSQSDGYILEKLSINIMFGLMGAAALVLNILHTREPSGQIATCGPPREPSGQIATCGPPREPSGQIATCGPPGN